MSVADETDCQTSEGDIVTGNSEDISRPDRLQDKESTTKDTDQKFLKSVSEYLVNKHEYAVDEAAVKDEAADDLLEDKKCIKTEKAQNIEAKEEEPYDTKDTKEEMAKEGFSKKVEAGALVEDNTTKSLMGVHKAKKMKLGSDDDDDSEVDDESEREKTWKVEVQKKVQYVELSLDCLEKSTERKLQELMSSCGRVTMIKPINGRSQFNVVFDCELAYQNALLLKSPTVGKEPVYVDSLSHRTNPIAIQPLPKWNETALQEYLREFFLRHGIIMSSLRVRGRQSKKYALARFADCRHRAQALELKTVQIGDCQSQLLCCGHWLLNNKQSPLSLKVRLPPDFRMDTDPVPKAEPRWKLEHAEKHLNVTKVQGFHNGSCIFTLADHAAWQSAVRTRRLIFQGVLARVTTWHKIPKLIVCDLPVDVNRHDICKSVQQFYEEHGAVVMNTLISPKSPSKMLVRFAECAGQQTALKLGPICIDGLTLPIKCCVYDRRCV